MEETFQGQAKNFPKLNDHEAIVWRRDPCWMCNGETMSPVMTKADTLFGNKYQKVLFKIKPRGFTDDVCKTTRFYSQ